MVVNVDHLCPGCRNTDDDCLMCDGRGYMRAPANSPPQLKEEQGPTIRDVVKVTRNILIGLLLAGIILGIISAVALTQ